MLNRTHRKSDADRVSVEARRQQRRHHRRRNREMLSLTLEFRYRSRALRGPGSVDALEQLLCGFETYTNYTTGNSDRLGRLLLGPLDGAWRAARRNLGRVTADRRFVARCERHALGFLTAADGEPDRTPVLFTLESVPEDAFSTEGVVFRTLVHQHRIAGADKSALLRAPKWFHDVLVTTWADIRRGKQHTAHRRERSVALAEARKAGLGEAFPADDVDLDALTALWDPDPCELYFDLGEVLPALGRL